MSIVSLSRLISLSIHPKQSKIFILQFSSVSSANKFFTLLEKKPSNIERTLALVNAKLDPNCVCEVLKRCSFDISLSQIGLRYSSYMYNKAAGFLKIKQNPFLVLDVVLNLCKEANIADEALLLLRTMPEFNLRPDITAYNVVIRLLCEKGDMDMAHKLMKEIGLIDLYPDMMTYFAMIKGFCNAGRLEEAWFSPNAVAYSVLLEGIWEMEKAGGNCSPNVITYTSVIKSFCEKGQTIEALRILDRMEACQCIPNRITVIILITGLCAEGHVEEAYKLIDRVAGRGVSNSDCYSSLAEKLFRKMLVSGAKPSGIACSTMIREICREGRVLDGFCLYNEIERMQYISSIDTDIYSILLVGLCRQSHSVETVKLARLMLRKRICLEAPYVDEIIEHLKNSTDKELVTQLSRIAS
ncbi:hypothetical protein E1A91_A02G166600v1 [Gossypium mustelinum]|uniref:Pentacotripeptide-repeat region of PRORP domain-containing protein n=1 Tax=Gossypium mustelinum TaxID=34275 RepID=A0A5D3A8D0_GOSMU|nr:hypothetical protein E1A91_A02G166600v1 [Gossypium mustelinum]